MSAADLHTPALRPDYQGGSIVNLMSSIAAVYGLRSLYYPVLTTHSLGHLDGCKAVVLVIIDGVGYKYMAGDARGSDDGR